ncbi:hypothetical protein [Amycolatopsis thermoflava]|uniref:hypothetical protein n=1 Tax=Amycolatopsis thermoflava TaxID=84480 RepID=UPI00364CD2DC
MSTVAEASAALLAALGTVDGVRPYSDASSKLDPPCTLLGPPQLDWTTYNPDGDPNTATFIVLAVVPVGDRAVEQLWELVPRVVAAVTTNPDAVVSRATPTALAANGSADLPAYQIFVEMSL